MPATRSSKRKAATKAAAKASPPAKKKKAQKAQKAQKKKAPAKKKAQKAPAKKAPPKKKAKPEPVDEPPSDEAETASEGSAPETIQLPPPSAKAPKAKAFKFPHQAPPFPGSFTLAKNVVLQYTDLVHNNNKYYALELHVAGGQQRLFTHFGRTGDLERNPNAGQRDVRMYDTLPDAVAAYNELLKKKTAPSKGYQPVHLTSSLIGSGAARGRSAGVLGAKTKRKLAEADHPKTKKAKPKKGKKACTLPPAVQELVQYIFDEATDALTSQVNVKITADGIKTPLGVLTVEQVEKGEEALAEIDAELKAGGGGGGGGSVGTLRHLSSAFYTCIPHRLGRSQAAIAAAVIRSEQTLKEKYDLCQLMKDMLKVSDSGAFEAADEGGDVQAQYEALGVDLQPVQRGSAAWKRVVANLDDKVHEKQLVHVFALTREAEVSRFNKAIGNEQAKYHGSRLRNWVGILTRGILLPAEVVKLGVTRTDFGWLGAGIYFGDADTSSFYCQPGRRNTCLMVQCNVALGKQNTVTVRDGSIQQPPKGFDSNLGDPRVPGSQFQDLEYCVYENDRHCMEYLIEFRK